jgi:hypothetical protein
MPARGCQENENKIKIELALKLGTSRAQINRLLDPDNLSITLTILENEKEDIICPQP